MEEIIEHFSNCEQNDSAACRHFPPAHVLRMASREGIAQAAIGGVILGRENQYTGYRGADL